MTPFGDIDRLLIQSLRQLRSVKEITGCSLSIKGGTTDGFTHIFGDKISPADYKKIKTSLDDRMPLFIEKKSGTLISLPVIIDDIPLGSLNLTVNNESDVKEAFSSAVAVLLNATIQSLSEIQQEKEYVETILNGIKHRILLIDKNYKILRLNKAALGKGKDSGDLSGAYCYDKFEKRDSVCVDCPAVGTFRNGEVLHILRRYHPPDAAETIFKISSYPVYNSKGEVIHAVVASRDITEVHRAEQIKNDLMQMLAHDIRNPILAITQTLDNCLKGYIHHDLVEETRDNCDLLLNMIDDVLDIYRHESNKFVISKREIDISRVIKSAVKLVDTLTRDKNIRIDLHLPVSMPSLIADENRIIRVIINLLENAIAYSPKNGKISVIAKLNRPHMTRSINKSLRPPLHVEVSISDSGMGIPAEDIEKIFDRYYRVERHGNTSRSGLGLGLTYCKQTIEAHGGKIWAESPVYRGKGSRFVFTLPVLGK